MKDHKVLITGDYWHPEFRTIVSSFDVPVTLVAIEKIETLSDSRFDLVVIAQSQRSQFLGDDIEKIHSMFINTPVVGLLGSWCEGETRSGTPHPGLTRIYWHQWVGRYDRFVEQLAQSGITSWHLPRTFSVADRILADSQLSDASAEIAYVGISAWTRTQHDMIADAISHFGWQSRWVERAIWDAESSDLISAICVDADSWCQDLNRRIQWIRQEIPETPIVLLLNYPRESELDEIQRAGISDVISKPFELFDLRSALVRSVQQPAAMWSNANSKRDDSNTLKPLS